MMEAAGDGGQRKTTRTAVAISAAISEAAAAVNWPVSGKRVKGSDVLAGAPIIIRPGIPRD